MSQDEMEDPANLRTICAAVIARAICDAYGKAVIDKNVRREAKYWIERWDKTSDLLSEWSFPWVCQHIDIDPVVLRRTLLAKGAENIHYRFSGHFDLNSFIRRMLNEDEFQVIRSRAKHQTH